MSQGSAAYMQTRDPYYMHACVYGVAKPEFRCVGPTSQQPAAAVDGSQWLRAVVLISYSESAHALNYSEN